MSQSRLSLALSAGRALPAEGTIQVFNARTSRDLADLPAGRLRIVQGFRPDHDALAQAGFSVAPVPDGRHGAAIVFIPRSRAAARAAVAAAVAAVPEGAPIWVDGLKTDGIDTLLRELRERVDLGDPVAKAHGKCAVFASPGTAPFADWRGKPTSPAEGFTAPPGAFSADGVDPGSALLAAALPANLKGRVADLGAGWGWLSAQILTRPAVSELHLIEAEHAALDAARVNVSDPRAQFHWADATTFSAGRGFDSIVSNPPFHATREADPALGAAFISAAGRMLAPHGALWLVANRQLPYEAPLRIAFQSVEEVAGDGRFKILHATRPIPERRMGQARGKPLRRARR